MPAPRGLLLVRIRARVHTHDATDPARGIIFPSVMRKKTFLSTGPETSIGANEASSQRFQNAVYDECHTKFLTKLWAFENRQFVWRLCKARLTENPYGKKKLFF
jgi:hypothetical protein